MKVPCTFLSVDGEKRVMHKRLTVDQSGCITFALDGVMRKFVVPDDWKRRLGVLVYRLDNPNPLNPRGMSVPVTPKTLFAISNNSMLTSLLHTFDKPTWAVRLRGIFQRRIINNFAYEVAADYFEKNSIPYDFDGAKVFIIPKEILDDFRKGKLR